MFLYDSTYYICCFSIIQTRAGCGWIDLKRNLVQRSRNIIDKSSVEVTMMMEGVIDEGEV